MAGLVVPDKVLWNERPMLPPPFCLLSPVFASLYLACTRGPLQAHV
jgi:hypothetical protein